MAKPELGTKRVCPETGRKFYDLNKDPVISPYTGSVVPIAALTPSRSRTDTAVPSRVVAATAEVETVVPETQEAEFVSLEDADAEAQGKKSEGEAVEGAEDIEIDDEPIDDDDAPFIEEQEEGDEDVADIIGDVEDDEER